MKIYLKKFHIILLLLGIDLYKIYQSFRFFPKYVRGFFIFCRQSSSEKFGPLHFFPALSDSNASSGDINSIYFLQDQIVAKMIFENGAKIHHDVGSRVDGFV